MCTGLSRIQMQVSSGYWVLLVLGKVPWLMSPYFLKAEAGISLDQPLSLLRFRQETGFTNLTQPHETLGS